MFIDKFFDVSPKRFHPASFAGFFLLVGMPSHFPNIGVLFLSSLLSLMLPEVVGFTLYFQTAQNQG